jgi:hypothetical protein
MGVRIKNIRGQKEIWFSQKMKKKIFGAVAVLSTARNSPQQHPRPRKNILSKF